MLTELIGFEAINHAQAITRKVRPNPAGKKREIRPGINRHIATSQAAKLMLHIITNIDIATDRITNIGLDGDIDIFNNLTAICLSGLKHLVVPFPIQLTVAIVVMTKIMNMNDVGPKLLQRGKHLRAIGKSFVLVNLQSYILRSIGLISGYDLLVKFVTEMLNQIDDQTS